VSKASEPHTNHENGNWEYVYVRPKFKGQIITTCVLSS